MGMIDNMLYGFSVALTLENVMFCLLGTLLGTLAGVLPGLGPLGAMAILLPITLKIPAASGLIMLAGVYYGVAYGGSTTSILASVPGEISSVVTCIDGHEMAKQGRAGAALGIAAFGSWIAGTLGIVGLMAFAVPLSNFALAFGSHEYFALIVLGLVFVASLSQGSVLRGVMMAFVGLILGNVGLDIETTAPRFTFGSLELSNGLSIGSLAMGLFGIREVLTGLEEAEADTLVKFKTKMRDLLPTKSDWLQSKWAMLRGTAVGFFLGLLPGGGPTLASFISYGVEKRFAKDPSRFGKGAIEGVAGPESANNSASSSAFIPLLTLGIPPTAALAVLYGAFMLHGVVPGPLLLHTNPDIFWGLVCSMYIGNVMLLVLNLPLIPMWVQVLRIPPRIFYPLILIFCLVGAYSQSNNLFDVYVMLIFGVVGYLFKKFGYEGAPLLLAFVLGTMFDQNLRQALLISHGSFVPFFTRPLSACILALAAAVLFFSIFSRRKRKLGESLTS